MSNPLSMCVLLGSHSMVELQNGNPASCCRGRAVLVAVNRSLLMLERRC